MDVQAKKKKAPQSAGCVTSVTKVRPTDCSARAGVEPTAAEPACCDDESPRPATDLADVSLRPASRSRPTHTSSNTAATRPAAPNAATRQLPRWMSVVMKTGVSAQPRLPVKPCVLNACPRRRELTRWLMIEKSTG